MWYYNTCRDVLKTVYFKLETLIPIKILKIILIRNNSIFINLTKKPRNEYLFENIWIYIHII